MRCVVAGQDAHDVMMKGGRGILLCPAPLPPPQAATPSPRRDQHHEEEEKAMVLVVPVCVVCV